MSLRSAIPLSIPVDHPAFAGHFPGAPVVPGVVLIDRVMFVIAAATGQAYRQIAWAKFLRPVPPGQALMIHYETDVYGSARFEITAGTDKVASGHLLVADTE